jgi:hypothetical protein
VNEAHIKEAEVKAKHAFIDLSLEEIELGFKSEISNQMQKLIGVDNYQCIYSIFLEYNKLRIMAIEVGAWYMDHPSKALNKQRNKLVQLLNKNADSLKNQEESND